MHMSDTKRKLIGVALLLATAIIWGSSFVVMKSSVDIYPVNYLLAIRFSIGCVFLCIVFRRRVATLDLRGFLGGALIGVTLYLAYLTQTEGLKRTTPSHNAFLTAIYVVLMPFFSWIFQKQRPGKLVLGAAALCIVGIGFISLSGDWTISLGDALSLLCGVLFAFQLLFISMFSRDYDAVALAAVQVGVCGACAWIMGAFTEPFPTVAIADASSWLPMLYLAIVSTGITQMTQNVGQTMMPASAASILLSLESVFGALFSVWFYGEQLTGRVILGFVLVFAAVIVSQTAPSAPPAVHKQARR